MGATIEFNDIDFLAKVALFEMEMKKKTMQGVNDVANEIMRLSQIEVPIKDSLLSQSGVVYPATNPDSPEAIVGYNKEYAAYQHEGHWEDGSHIITHHTNPRSKTKYLEDPIRNNLELFMAKIAGSWG